jgi:hypothetical protein
MDSVKAIYHLCPRWHFFVKYRNASTHNEKIVVKKMFLLTKKIFFIYSKKISVDKKILIELLKKNQNVRTAYFF